MVNFNAIRLDNAPNYLFIATNFRSSLSNLSLLTNELNLEHGKVLFDLMLIQSNKKIGLLSVIL